MLHSVLKRYVLLQSLEEDSGQIEKDGEQLRTHKNSLLARHRQLQSKCNAYEDEVDRLKRKLRRMTDEVRHSLDQLTAKPVFVEHRSCSQWRHMLRLVRIKGDELLNCQWCDMINASA